jgi:predicted transcriptional regulator
MAETPGPKRELDDDEILQYISQEYGPAVGTGDVADYFDVTNQGAKKYLDRLSDEGFINTRKVGRARIWWLTEMGEKRVSPHDSSDGQ